MSKIEQQPISNTQELLDMLLRGAVDFCNGESSAEAANTKCNFVQKTVAILDVEIRSHRYVKSNKTGRKSMAVPLSIGRSEAA